MVVLSSFELHVQAAVPDPVGEARWSDWFGHWLAAVPLPGPSVELAVRLTDDDEIRQLNSRFRGLDAPTDVLSFEAGDAPAEPDEPLYLGDIVISVPTATRQAATSGHAVEVELGWLAAHGLLHLLGWDHPDEESWQAMVHRQAELLEGVNLRYDWPSVYANS